MAPLTRLIQRLGSLEWNLAERLFQGLKLAIMQTHCLGEFNRNCSMLEQSALALPAAFQNRCRLSD